MNAPATQPHQPPTIPAGQHDFDFLVGSWRVEHQRLKRRLAACDEWEHFSGTSHLAQFMAGRVNLDDNMLELPAGTYRAVTLRSFDPASGLWAIWWLDGRHPHQIDTPMIGSFTDGVGTFYADDTFEGRPIRVRFLWTGITAQHCHWEQAFSTDGGLTWETNWRMAFARTG